MIKVHHLTYNPFSENTYILSDEHNNAIIIDPGMYFAEENAQFFEYINQQKLNPVRLILTHAHLDHVFGINWVNQTYGLVPELNILDQVVYDSAVPVANQYGLSMKPLVDCVNGLEDTTSFRFGDNEVIITHAPGHSPGSVCFYSKTDGFIIAGDAVFHVMIGRTDLP